MAGSLGYFEDSLNCTRDTTYQQYMKDFEDAKSFEMTRIRSLDDLLQRVKAKEADVKTSLNNLVQVKAKALQLIAAVRNICGVLELGDTCGRRL